MAANGHDDDFNRGGTTYDNFYMWGDPAFDPPCRALGAIDRAPYYAVKMEAGALGSAGRPTTNGDARVHDWDGNPIHGLYAADNAMAAVLGKAYGGAGGTLAPGDDVWLSGWQSSRDASPQLPNILHYAVRLKCRLVGDGKF